MQEFAIRCHVTAGQPLALPMNTRILARTLFPVVIGLAACIAPASAVEQLSMGKLGVSLDPGFPRVISYTLDGRAFTGQDQATGVIEINGKPATATIRFAKSSAHRAIYTMDFPAEKVSMTLAVELGENTMRWKVTGIKEAGAVKVMNFAMPGNALLTVSSAQKDPLLAFAVWDTQYTWGPDHVDWLPGGHYSVTTNEEIGGLADRKPGAVDGTYGFVSADGLAAGLASGNYSSGHRIQRVVTEAGGRKTCQLGLPIWEVRTLDDDKPNLPWAMVMLAPDINDDGKADWQDAALAYRATMPKPLGHDEVKNLVGENIAMNFASGAQQPFLRILDGIKRFHLATDGLGSHVIIKGFSSEGHDSANTDYADHWNERAGGLRDLNVLLANAGKYNSRVGIHINTSEFYPESNRFDPELFDLNSKGQVRKGWVWLDQSIMINQMKDFHHGTALAALDKMRKSLPGLDFVYVDTFMHNGWPARALAGKLNGLGLPIYTEVPAGMDPDTVWTHGRKGGSQLFAFLWYSDRDITGNDPILRGGRSDDDGFMGWQNRHNFTKAIHGTFTRRLPAKFLQHFDLQRLEPGKQAWFSNGVKATKDGDVTRVTRDGRLLMQWNGAGTGTRMCLPWSPIKAEKLYLFDEVGGEQTWDLPPAWKNLPEVFLYTLTDGGRTAESRVPVVDGRITVNLPKDVPHVAYPAKAPANKPVDFGAGGPIADPGFDSLGFSAWKPSDPAAAKITHDANGHPQLELSGPGACAVSQRITGLKPGASYLAGVWVKVAGTRTATLAIEAGKSIASLAVDKTDLDHKAPNDPRSGTKFQYLKLRFTVPAATDRVTIKLSAAACTDGSSVAFDDVRVVRSDVSPEAAKHTYWEDFEHVDLGGYGPFTCCPGERTHLSEANPPHTTDTIHGKFSLKSRDGGRVLRTLPSSLPLKPNTRYKISCQAMGQGRLTAEEGKANLLTLKFPAQAGPITGEFTTGPSPDAYLALYRDGGDAIVIDDLAVDELGQP